MADSARHLEEDYRLAGEVRGSYVVRTVDQRASPTDVAIEIETLRGQDDASPWQTLIARGTAVQARREGRHTLFEHEGAAFSEDPRYLLAKTFALGHGEISANDWLGSPTPKRPEQTWSINEDVFMRDRNGCTSMMRARMRAARHSRR